MSTTQEQIKPETLALIERRAKVFGLTVDDYLRSLLPKEEKELLALKADEMDAEFEADMIAFAEGTEDLPPYNGDYSREDIYLDHD